MFVEKAIKAKLQLSATVEEAPGSNFVCPSCGGPAEMETFWSTSPQRPGLKILKRQIFCGKRPRRGFRNRPMTGCPVVVEEIGTEPEGEVVVTHKPQLSIVKLEVAPPPDSESPEINSKGPKESWMESSSEGSALGRGRLPAELRNQILEMSSSGIPADDIAARVGRSPAAVRKVLSVDEHQGENFLELDQVIDFLSSLPEEAIDEVLQLARLQRERSQLRSSLEIRLKDMKKIR